MVARSLSPLCVFKLLLPHLSPHHTHERASALGVFTLLKVAHGPPFFGVGAGRPDLSHFTSGTRRRVCVPGRATLHRSRRCATRARAPRHSLARDGLVAVAARVRWRSRRGARAGVVLHGPPASAAAALKFLYLCLPFALRRVGLYPAAAPVLAALALQSACGATAGAAVCDFRSAPCTLRLDAVCTSLLFLKPLLLLL